MTALGFFGTYQLPFSQKCDASAFRFENTFFAEEKGTK
jgi:hypothetical protein